LPPLGIYIEGEARQANYRLNCSGEFTRSRFGHSEVFEKMTNEWPSILAPRDKIVTIIAFGRGFLVEPGNIGKFAIRWCDFLHRRFILWLAGGCWSVFGYLSHKGILCTWLTSYGLPNRGICNSRLF
jgi:hypothetical protein